MYIKYIGNPFSPVYLILFILAAQIRNLFKKFIFYVKIIIN